MVNTVPALCMYVAPTICHKDHNALGWARMVHGLGADAMHHGRLKVDVNDAVGENDMNHQPKQHHEHRRQRPALLPLQGMQ